MKKYIKALMLIFIIAIALNAKVHAQAAWRLSQSKGNVDFYYSISTCNADTVVLLKFVNKNSVSVKVGWKEVFETQYGKGMAGYSGAKQMTIAPGVTEETNCLSASKPDCIIRSDEVHPAYIARIRNFSFAEITVN